MIVRKKNFFLLFLFLSLFFVAPGFLRAQKLNRFSGDSVKFIGELNILFLNLAGNEEKMAKDLMVDFIQLWNQEEYNPSQKRTIYSVGNQMLKKKMRAFPDFYNFILAFDRFKRTHQPESSFKEWTDILKKLIETKYIRHYTTFLEFSINLFTDDLIYKSSSTQWKIHNAKYSFSYDSVPVIDFAVSDMVCYSSKDSINIYNTRGFYKPLTNRWFGTGGRVDWRRAGLDPRQVFADLKDYDISANLSKFSCENVEFYNKKYFPYPLSGYYMDKVQADITEEMASYPRFYSYDKQIGIRNVFPNIDYLGGFAMEGSRLVGSGDKTHEARLDFIKGGQDIVTIRSQTFIIRPDRISSAKAKVAIYHENDSIFHPALQMKYIDEKKELTLTKDERSASISPWFDSWHSIEIYCEALFWKVNEAKIGFEMMKGPNAEGRAVFESSNYYSGSRYDKLQGMDELNPLHVIKTLSERKNSREITLDELVSFMQKPAEKVEVQLLTLSNKGFLLYDEENKKAILKDKLFDYVKAKNGKTDYDVIFFNSTVSGGSNAVLNLDNFDLKIQGVPSVFLSDSQMVYIYPKNQEIVLKKDRDFLFSGKVEAGLFDFYARECSFEYEKFRLNLPTIDSMGFYVPGRTRDPRTGKFPLVRVKTYLTGLSGDLLIDDPGNKSGLKALQEYPVFNSKNEALASWDKKYIQNGVYKKNKFYYKVYPFTFWSIGRYPTDSLQFKGYLCSAGIFPDIEKPLKVRPDYSLGIETITDEKGLPVYGGKGTFISKIDLSNEGLIGNGELIYLNSISYSDRFIFYPDSLKTLARRFESKEMIAAVEFPAIHGDSVREMWLPYKDSLVIGTEKKELAMYHDQSFFSGNLGLTPKGFTGEGTIKIRDAEMDSKTFQFKQSSFDANIANFRIRSVDLNELSISTKNYQTHFDFADKKGEFKSNVGISKVEFPFNKYICSMDRFDWMIDNEEISLSNEMNQKVVDSDTMSLAGLIDVASPGSEFISVHPLQDSLRFFALRAKYNLRTNLINAEGVKLIRVADAAVFPDSGKVIILKDAQLKPLTRANIIADRSNKYHNFYNATVSITSRNKYTASSSYDYVDRNGEREMVAFKKIYVDTTGQTRAEGIISEDANFRLSPEFAFIGDVSLKAKEKNLFFDGGFRPLSDCNKSAPFWVQFNATIDPLQIQIPVSSPIKDIRLEKLFLGLLYSNTENRIYPAFFTKRRSFSDSVMSGAEGMLTYNVPTGKFNVSVPVNTRSSAYPLNTLSLNTSTCLLETSGKINLNLSSAPLKIETYGRMDYFMIPDSVKSDIALTMDFPFSQDALDKFRTHVESINLEGVDISKTPYHAAMEQMLPKKDIEKLDNEMSLMGKFKKFPDEMDRTLFFADVRLSWDSVNKSWISYGPIGIGSIQKNQVNRYVRGIIEFTKKRNGDDLTIYLQLTENDWYFFNYRNKILQVLSSNLDFNDQVMNGQKSSAEQRRVDNIMKGFRYIISTDRKKREFLKKFEKEE